MNILIFSGQTIQFRDKNMLKLL